MNDELTLKVGTKKDVWFHTKDIPGSHVIVVSGEIVIDDETIKEAAMIAAYHSRAKSSSQVPVDYTEIRYVKKPTGSKPGMVIYTDQSTMYVTPDIEKIEKLRI